MTYDIYSCLGNQVRAKLILCLSRYPKNVTQLIDSCGLSQSAVSQHLAKLRKAGLVRTVKTGKEIRYSVRFRSCVTVSQLLQKLEKEVGI